MWPGGHSAATVVARARALGVEMPLAEAVNEVLQGRLTPLDAVQRLMHRDARMEAEGF
jgi:glycerol-3-phosphate dehydrogenase (NAD(P)+)